jgi:hypothetical protein
MLGLIIIPNRFLQSGSEETHTPQLQENIGPLPIRVINTTFSDQDREEKNIERVKMYLIARFSKFCWIQRQLLS